MARQRALAIVILFFVAQPSMLHGDTVRAWEGTIEIPTYLLGAPDPNPPFPLTSPHNVYPYAMLDDLTDKREMKSYRALFLENGYLRATILPELGGRLYSLFDKAGRREVFYRNHVVKYGLVALRGAWISGGVEFNFPNGHTMLTVSPVEARFFQNSDGSATVVVGAMDWVTDMHWEVALTLRPGAARLEQHVILFNSTPLENLYWYWANAAVPATEDMQFDYPMREANPHVAGEGWTYPVWHGVDYSWYKNIRQPTSLFGRQVHRNFFGGYYHDSDFGVVHVADYRQVPGKKIWSWGVAEDGLLWTDLLTDHDGPYNEIQSGRYETQLTQEFMPPRRVESWTEYWYPVQGLGRPWVEATDSLALAVNEPHSANPAPGPEIALFPTIDVPKARVTVTSGDRTVLELTSLDLHAGAVKRIALSEPDGSSSVDPKALAVEVKDQNGGTILHWSAAEPVDGNPEFVSAASARAESEPQDTHASVEAFFLSGVDQEKHGHEKDALTAYRQVLERDPSYIPALLKLARYSYRGADLVAAESFIKPGLARNSTDSRLQYAAGLIYRAQARWALAEDAFWTSIHFGGAIAPALDQLGELSILQKRYDEAARYLQNALAHEPDDALTRTDLAVAQRLGGHAAEARKTVDGALKLMPLFPFALAEAWRLGAGVKSEPSSGPAPVTWDRPFPQDAQYYLDLAAWYLRLGDSSSAMKVLDTARDQLPAAAKSPLFDYYMAYATRQRDDRERADSIIKLAYGRPDNGVFPDRLQDEVVLRDAASHFSKDGHIASLLGTFLFAHGRYDEAANQWREAVDDGFTDPVLERNLGVYDWRVKGDLRSAASFYEKAIRLAPDQYRFYPDLDEIYSEMGDTNRRTRLFTEAPGTVLDRDVVRMRRALLLLEQQQFDSALGVLSHHRFEPWEGGEMVRKIYVLANVQKGRSDLQNGASAQAEQAFRQALEYPQDLGVGKPDRPADAQPFYWLGEALIAQGKTDGARAAWQEAAEESAGDAMTTRVYRAAALLRLGQIEEGRPLMAEAIASAGLHDVDATEFYAAGLAQEFSNNVAEARRDLQRAVNASPSFWQASVELAYLSTER